jgi:hypothetical protein
MDKVLYSGQYLVTGTSTIQVTGVTRVSRLSSVIRWGTLYLILDLDQIDGHEAYIRIVTP